MMRQCAWCLCLIDKEGERLSLSPFPKLYEASHGICCICGPIWVAQAFGLPEVTDPDHECYKATAIEQTETVASSDTQIVLQVSQQLLEGKISPSVQMEHQQRTKLV